MRVLISLLVFCFSFGAQSQDVSEVVLNSCLILPKFNAELVVSTSESSPSGPWAYEYFYRESQTVLLILGTEQSETRPSQQVTRVLNHLHTFTLEQGPFLEDAVAKLENNLEHFRRVREFVLCAQ